MSALPESTVARRARLAWLAALVFLIAAPFIGLYPIFMMNALCFAIFACAFNLLLGFTGLLSFGHAAYLGAAAYFTGWLIKSAGFTPELGILAGMLGAGLIGLVVGLIAIRRQGIYFAMITLAMAQMVYFVWLQAPFTGGEDGLQGVPRGKLFGLLPLASDIAMYFVVLAVFVAVFLAIIRIVRSPYGQVLKAIRENEPRAVSLGYDVDRYKLLAFVLSTSLAGLAGSLKTVVLGFATLSDAHWSLSGEVVLMTLLVNVFFPFGLSDGWASTGALRSLFLFSAKLLLLAAAVALVETTNAKMRLFRVPELLTVAFVLSAMALISTFLF